MRVKFKIENVTVAPSQIMNVFYYWDNNVAYVILVHMDRSLKCKELENEYRNKSPEK